MTLATQFRGLNRGSAQRPNGHYFQTFSGLKLLIREGKPFSVLPLAVKMPMESTFEALVIAGKHEKNVQLTSVVEAQLIDALIGLGRPANFYEVIVGAGKINPSAASVSIVPVPRFALGALHRYDGGLPAIPAFIAVAQEHRNTLYHGYSVTKICYVITIFSLTDNVPIGHNWDIGGGYETLRT